MGNTSAGCSSSSTSTWPAHPPALLRNPPPRRQPTRCPPLRKLAEALVRKALQWLFRSVVGRLAAIPVRRRLNAFERATNHPQAVQEELLRRILAEASATGFARDHHFGQVQTVADFRKNVPVAGYEYVEPYMK